MRIAALDLIRFGHFTDFSLDFGDKPDTDFHLIYGPNEAGKSTIRAAYLDLLFGIPHRSDFQFLHAETMEIGGALDVDGSRHRLTRVKGRKQTLRGENGEAVPDTLLSGVLGSIGRSDYEAMFSLDDQTIEAGGDDILGNKGDLGELLFAGASGLAAVGARLDLCREHVAAFHRPRARTSQLANLKRNLEKKKAEIRELDVKASDYEALRKDHETAIAQYDDARLRLSDDRQRHSLVDRILSAQRLVARRKAFESELESFQDIADLPKGWRERGLRLRDDDQAVRLRIDTERAALKRLVADRDAIEIDQAILDQGLAIDAAAGLKSGFDEALKDIPNRRRELEVAERDVAKVLARLGKTDNENPASLVLPPGVPETLRDLIEQHGVLTSAASASKDELKRAKRNVQTARQRLAGLGPLADHAVLRETVAQIRRLAVDQEIDQHEQRVEDLKNQRDHRIRRLHPWKGTPGDLEELSIPSGNWIAAWRDERATARQSHAAVKAELEAARRSLDDAEAEAEGLSQGVDVDLDDALVTLREARRAAWRDHRTALSAREAGQDPAASPEVSALTFEAALEAELAAVERRLSQADAFAAVGQAQAKCRLEAAYVAKVEARFAREEATLAKIGDDAEPVLITLGLPGDFEPDSLQTWLDARAEAVVLINEVRSAEAVLNKAQQSRDAVLSALKTEMTALEIGFDDAKPLADLLVIAEARIKQFDDRSAEVREARRTLDAAEEAAAERQADADEAEAAVESWSGNWAKSLDECWIGKETAEPAPAAVRDILSSLEGFSLLLERRDDLAHRIGAMTVNREAFETAVRALAGHFSGTDGTQEALSIWQHLQRRLVEAKQAEKLRETRQLDIGRTQNSIETAEIELAALDKRFQEFAEIYPAKDMPDLVRQLERASEKADLSRRMEDCNGELTELFPDQSLSETLGMLGQENDIDALTAEQGDLEAGIDLRETEIRQFYHRMKSASDQLEAIGGDDAVARLEEEIAALLLEIEHGARRYLEQSLGILAVENALREFRDRHRGSMMRRASEAFQTITRGRFVELRNLPRDGAEILVGLKADGGSIEAREMSKGTRFQLYLALRVAGYAEYAKRGQTLPFFADDILETFDDDRSKETFGLLGQMARTGQVIYMTHHEHLCDIARAACGNQVRIHQLPAP